MKKDLDEKEDSMSRDDLIRAIRQKQIDLIGRMAFQGNPPVVKTGFLTETELWDFKSDCPRVGRPNLAHWADIARHVLAFHNHKGGLLFFGIKNNYSFCGASTTPMDSKLLNDQLRKFLGDRIWVEFQRAFIQKDQKYLGIALVPPRGPIIERFRADFIDEDGICVFRKGDSAIRRGDSSIVLSKKQTDNI